VPEAPEITFIVTYECPRCQAALEARTAESQTWLRCPKCGRASLPPEHMEVEPPARSAPAEDFLIIGPERLDRLTPEPPQGALAGSGRRIALATFFIGSLGMLLIAFVDQNPGNMTIFGILTVVFLGLLAITGGRR
jgi:hypothetical protein